MLQNYSLGVDIGSTTMKVALIDEQCRLIFYDYRRHNADIKHTAEKIMSSLHERVGECLLRIVITGSVGMGVAERLGFRFVQEVVAAVQMVRTLYPNVRTFIDMGGEDSKMIFFPETEVGVPDIRMNGSCAGGTGAFIDQTATLLGVETIEMNSLAENAQNIYPIASRCGVFSKTDIQNLIARNVSKQDIAASVFHAVAVQVVSSLARGMEIRPQLFFCGGPFAFLPQLRKAFLDILSLSETDCVIPENAQIVPAAGCALLASDERTVPLTEIIENLQRQHDFDTDYSNRLPALFSGENDYQSWLANKRRYFVKRAPFSGTNADNQQFLGCRFGFYNNKTCVAQPRRRACLFRLPPQQWR